MNPQTTLTCKPTQWFLIRAVVIFLMFSVFSVLFYIDGSTGYRKKNENYHLNKTFQLANSDFVKMNTSGTLTADVWKTYAQKQIVSFPEDRTTLPANIKLPMPWPAILQDYDKMKSLQWNLIWREYTKEKGLNASPPKEPYNAQKIREQWVVFWFCVTLSVFSAFILIRTITRSISVDAESLHTQDGKKILFKDMNILDLRKWQTKGLAYITYEGASGKGKVRIDGLTYGGFKAEQNEPAERLIEHIQANFSGEVISYAPVEESENTASEPSETP